MELLLTPVVNRILSKFVRKVGDGTSGSQLRASLSGGSVVLHNLELNLDSVLGGLPIVVKRAFARQLKINISWTALASQPILVVLDTVEVVVALNDSPARPATTDSQGGEDTAGGGWLGSITSLLLRALFNVSVRVNNLVVKYLAPTSVATLTCQSIRLHTATDGWQSSLSSPESWLKKELEIQKAALWLEERLGEGVVQKGSQLALLRVPSLSLGALLPLFAIIEGSQDEGSELQRGAVQILLPSANVAVNERQLEWLRTFAARLKAMQRAKPEEVAAVDGEAVRKSIPPTAIPAIGSAPDGMGTVRVPAASKQPAGNEGQGWITGVAGRAWSYVTNEAAALDATGPPPPLPRPKLNLDVQIQLQEGTIWLAHCAAPGESAPARRGTSLPVTARDVASMTAPVSPAPASPMTSPSGPSAPLLATLTWLGAHARLGIDGTDLASAEASLVQASLTRPVTPDKGSSAPMTPFNSGEDEVMGLHAVPEVDSLALRREQDSATLAASFRWRRAPEGATDLARSQPVMSLCLGRFSVAYPAGFATDVALYVRRSNPMDGAAISFPAPRVTPTPAGQNAVPRWLKAGPAISLAVLSLHVAALSSMSATAEAVSVAVDRTSAHLGPVKTSSRFGSTTAALFALRQAPVPERGLRVSFGGLQLGVATRWRPSEARDQTGFLQGCDAVCKPIEVQALCIAEDLPAGHGPDASSAAAKAGGVATAVLGPLSAQLTMQQVGALLAVACGLRAEADRKLEAGLPSRHFPTDPAADETSESADPSLPGPTSLPLLTLEVGGISCVAGLTGREDMRLASSGFLVAPAGGSVRVLAAAPSATAGLHFDRGSVAVEFTNPLLWGGPGMGLYLPAAGVRVGGHHQSGGQVREGGDGQAAEDGIEGFFGPSETTRWSECCKLGEIQIEVKPPQKDSLDLEGEEANAKPATPLQIFLAVASVEVVAASRRWEELLEVGVRLCGQLLPQIPAYPTPAAAGASSLLVHLSVGAIKAEMGGDQEVGAVVGTAAERWIQLEAAQLELSFEQRAGEGIVGRAESGAQEEAAPQLTRTIHISLLGLALSAGSPFSKLLRFEEGAGKAISLTVRMQPGGSSVDLLSISAEALPLSIDFCPANISGIATFWDQSRHAVVQAREELISEARPSGRNSRYAGQSRRLSVRVAIPGITLSCPSDGVDLVPGLVVESRDVVVVLNEAEGAFPGCPATLSGNLLLQAVQTRVFGPGLSASGDAILTPLDAHVTIKLIPGGTALVLDTPVIELHVSPARLHALSRASGAFICGKQDPPAGDRAVPSEAAEGGNGGGLAPSEDLRCGLFERTQVAASRPGPLQFSYGDKQPGLMPWSGQGESWICWRYPYPRAVTTVLVTLPLEVLKSADLELLAFSPAADCFIPAECNMAAVPQPDLYPAAGQCDAAVLLSLKAAAVVAEEWQLCWEVPPDAPYLRASFMLHHTYVNPSAGVVGTTDKYVAPLKVPITLGLAAQQMEVHVTDDAGAASCPELALVSVHDIKVAVHMWKGVVAARAAGALQLSCVDETSLCMETILAPSRFSLALESASLNRPQVLNNVAGLRHLAPGRVDLTLPFPAPGTEGLAVSLRCCEGPVVVHLSELGTHSLLRVVNRATMALAAHNKKEGASNEQTFGGQKRLGAESPVILLENQTQLVLETRQVGSREQAVLRPGSAREHIWEHERGGGLKRLLQLRVSKIGSAEGESEALQERRASNTTASTSGVAHSDSCWSRGLDILSPGMTICEVPTNEPGVAAVLAVHVSKLSGRWSVSLLPGCSVENHSAHKLLLAHLSLLPGSAAQVSANITLGSAGSSTSEPAMRRLQPYVAQREGVAAKTLTTVRLWMGQGNGWSHPVPLSNDSPCQVIKAQAAGFGGSSPSAPSGNPTHTPGPLHLHTSASPSHLSLAVWPAFLLENHLPIPLQWRVRHPSQSDGDAQPPATCCPPGGKVPLEGYVSGEDTLAVKLDLGSVTTGEKGSVEAGWSQGMTGGGRAGSYGWGLSSAAQHALPAPGQTRVLELACGPSTLAVNLSAEHARPGVPCLRLKVSPAGVVQNCTSLPVRLHPQGASDSEVQPGKIAAVDWQPLRQRPGKASLSHTTSEGVCLLSEPFALEAGDIWLTLRAPLPGGQGGAVLYLGMRLEVSQYPVQASTPSCETVHLTVTPGCFVTNLTPWQLLCQPSKIVGPSAASQIQVGQKASVPLTRVWATKAPAARGSGAAASSKRLLEKGVDGGVGVYVSIFDPGGNPPASPVADSGPGTSGGSFVDLSGPQPRHRLQLGAGGGSHLVTCRVISSRGHLHAVLFQDRKPPVLLQNTTAVALEVGYFLPEVNKLGEVQHEAAEAIFIVPGNGSCECSFTADHLLGGDDWDEDEESFLERVTGVSSPSNGHIGKLKLRRQGSTAWSEACDIVEPSLHKLGDLQLEMHRSCASLRCIVSDPSQAAKDLSQPPAALPTSIAFEIQNLQVCLLEDERGKWRDLGAIPGTNPLELFCISLSGIRLSLQQQSPHGGQGGVGPRRRLHSVNVAAQALQIDSYLPDSSHPVLCSSVPGRPQRLKGIQEDNPLPPLLLALQVEHDAGQGDSKGMSFRNTWLRSLGVRLPTLALAVDDALIGFAERLANILGAPPAVTALPAGDARGAPKADQRVHSRTEAPRLSPRKPYFDLSGLDSLDPDSRLAHLQDPRPPPGSAEGVPGLAVQVATALEVELLAEATAASASRLLIEVLSLGRVSLLLDLHASQGNQHIPMSIDTHRTPLGLPEVVADSLHFRPSVMLQGLLAHYAAEALLNAPAVLGSLDLLLNPTGLMNSLARGFEDLVSLPLAALEARSPSQFVAGLGLGSASMVRHVSGWTLTSISGFSSAFSRVLHHSLSVQGSTRGAAQNCKGAGGIAGGLQGLAGGVSQGVTGLYRAPLAGYSSGSGGGLALGVGRGLLGAVGLPLSGALDLVSSISTGIANTAGIAHHPRLRRPGLTLGDLCRQAAATRFRRWASQRQEEYVGHCMPLLILGPVGQRWATPVALLTSTNLHVLDGASLCPLLHLSLAGMSMREDSRASKIQLQANATSSPSSEAWQVTVELGVTGWHLWLPLLRSRLQ